VSTVTQVFDLTIATLTDGEPAPPGAHLVRLENPAPADVRRFSGEGWFYKPSWVTYVLSVPRSLDDHLAASFDRHARHNIRRLLREVPRRYRLEVDERGAHAREFHELYRRTVVRRPRGIDRVAEYAGDFSDGWLGFHLLDQAELVAGVMVQRMHRHLSVAYGAFDPARRRKHDLEHFLLLQVLDRAIASRHRFMSLGVDTNRYGHHLSLGVAPYKLRIGFTPMPYEPGGRELMKIQSFDPFPDGLFFYAYGEGGGLVGHFFARGKADLTPYRHPTCPPIEPHVI
jgi:hypothetical protein